MGPKKSKKEEKLDRRNEKVQRFEERNTELEKQAQQLREDKADIVGFLKRMLQQRTDTIGELTDRLQGMKVAHQAERESYEDQLASLRAEYSRTKEELNGEIMVLTKKLDSLEEYRQQREILMSKFEKLESDNIKQKDTYENRIYELERSHIREQDRLKNEMLSKVETVASEFRKVAHSQMAATTQRTIRENVNISSQLSQLTEKANSLTNENDKLVAKDKDSRIKISLLETELAILTRKNAYRQRVIEDLTEKCKSQEEKIGQVRSLEEDRKNLKKKISDLNSNIGDLKHKLDEGKNEAKLKDTKMSKVNKDMTKVEKDKNWLDTCLKDASTSIQKCLSLVEDTDLDENEAKTQRENVLNQILMLLNADISKIGRDSIEESGSEEGAYTTPRSRRESRVTGGGREDDESSTGDGSGQPMHYMSGALGLVPHNQQ